MASSVKEIERCAEIRRAELAEQIEELRESIGL
jgi:hypothetical protein